MFLNSTVMHRLVSLALVGDKAAVLQQEGGFFLFCSSVKNVDFMC